MPALVRRAGFDVQLRNKYLVHEFAHEFTRANAQRSVRTVFRALSPTAGPTAARERADFPNGARMTDHPEPIRSASPRPNPAAPRHLSEEGR